MDKHGKNRRRYPRVASEALLDISHPAFGMLSLRAKDASHGGFFAWRGMSPLPPENTEVSVIIRRHTGTINTDPITMRVVRVTDEGIGLEFVA